MASLPCPNDAVIECGGTIRFDRHHEYDVNAHWVEISDQDCACELTADQVEALCDQAAQLPMAEWEADDEIWAEAGIDD